MRILHIANFSLFKNEAVYYSIDRKISNGLIRNGHCVSDFSYRDLAKYSTHLRFKKYGIKKMQNKIFQTLDNLEPQLILLGHTELIDFETLQEIKIRYPDIKIAMWWVDWLRKTEVIESKISYLDALFLTTGIDVIPERFKQHNTIISYLPNMCDSSIESYRGFKSVSYKYDLFFAGRLEQNRLEYLETLIAPLGNSIYFKHVGDSKATLLYGNKFLKTISESRFALNLSRDHTSSLYSSDRIIQLLSNGTMVLSKYIPDMEQLFNSNELIQFKTNKEFYEALEYYSYHEEKRKEIAENGWKKAHQSYNSTRVTNYMIETIFKMRYTQEYEWENQSIYT